MASLIDYHGLQVVSPDPIGTGGLAIQGNFKSLVDWNPKGVWSQSTSPTATDDNTQEFFPGSLWLRTDTTPPQLFVCKSSATAAASWLPILLNVVQDTSPKLGGDLDVNGHKIKDASAVTITVSGNSVATVTSSAVQIQGNTLIGTTTTPTGATFNIAVGGGSTSPVLGAATVDLVSLAAVDKGAGDRRLYIQSETGSAISLGNDRLNFAAATGVVGANGVDVLSIFYGGLLTVNGSGSAAADTRLALGGIGNGGTNRGTAILLRGPGSASEQDLVKLIAYTTGGATTSQSSDFAIQTSLSGTLAETARLTSVGNLLLGTSATPSSAKVNLVLGGGMTSPVLGAATADIVSLAAVDNAAGDRRLYIQSELGSAISIGNDRLNFGASTGLVCIAGTEFVTMTSTLMTLGINANADSTQLVISNTNATGGSGLRINRSSNVRQAALIFSLSGTAEWYVGEMRRGGSANTTFTIGSGNDVNTTAPLLAIATSGLVGLGVLVPSFSLSFEGTGLKSIGIERNTTAASAGSSMVHFGGSATLSSTDKNGGDFVGQGGVSTGTGSSNVIFRAAPSATSTGAGDNTVIEIVRFTGLGANQLHGLTAVPTGATYNYVLGGGSATPVLASATTDAVCLAAVDRAAGDRRLYIQSESGSPISLGNNRLNYASATGVVSIGGTDVLNVTANGVGVGGTLATGNALSVTRTYADTAAANGMMQLLPIYTVTTNAALQQYIFSLAPLITISAGVTSSGSVGNAGFLVSMIRGNASDLGSLGSLQGGLIQYGHNGVVGATAVTTAAVGLRISPFYQAGTVTTAYDLLLSSAGTGGTIATHYSIYQQDTAAINYFGGTGCLFGTLVVPTGSTFNLTLGGGGTTTPVLGAATADIVSLAAVDKAAGDRRLYIQSETGSAISLGNDRLNFAASSGILSIGGADIIGLSSLGATLLDAMNIVLGSTIGTKIGTSTSQKLGFWNASPVTQFATPGTSAGFSAGTGTAVNSVSTFTGNVGSNAYTIGDIVAALKKCGLMAS